MTRLYRFKSKQQGAHYATIPICDDCMASREAYSENQAKKFPSRGGAPINSRLEKLSDDAKGAECNHLYRVSGEIRPGWADAPEGATKQ